MSDFLQLLQLAVLFRVPCWSKPAVPSGDRVPSEEFRGKRSDCAIFEENEAEKCVCVRAGRNHFVKVSGLVASSRAIVVLSPASSATYLSQSSHLPVVAQCEPCPVHHLHPPDPMSAAPGEKAIGSPCRDRVGRGRQVKFIQLSQPARLTFCVRRRLPVVPSSHHILFVVCSLVVCLLHAEVRRCGYE